MKKNLSGLNAPIEFLEQGKFLTMVGLLGGGGWECQTFLSSIKILFLYFLLNVNVNLFVMCAIILGL